MDGAGFFRSKSNGAASSSSNHQKSKHHQVFPHEKINISDEKAPHSTGIISGISSAFKKKQIGSYYFSWPLKAKGPVPINTMYSSGNNDSTNSSIDYSLETHEQEIQDLDYFDQADEYSQYEDAEDTYYNELINHESNHTLTAKFDSLNLSPVEEDTLFSPQKLAPESASDLKQIEQNYDEIDAKFKSFKKFDIVQDFSDHHYAKHSSWLKPGKDWNKRIQHDWSVLEKDLPEMIYVRVYEQRMDLLRAVIVGPSGTPYHDGLFFFDFRFPTDYPNSPPKVYYCSHGYRLNPNLYHCGKVCLSLLNTWTGSGCEKWSKSKSTILQVLLSIQALVLNEKPYFNEPAFVKLANTPNGETNSLAYNEKVFLLSCKTMQHSLRRPPKHFEDLVAGHFHQRGHTILMACKAYLADARVGSDVLAEKQEKATCHMKDFKASLKTIFDELLTEFSAKGVDCKEFLDMKENDDSGTSSSAAAKHD
ncbi:putative ubiquitin-conjugating enzyme E2 38 isoform X4 [Ananas comosus]|uniref:E2 ubiquitin-conjugating enzyme n=1 Tax=Ananas comosus TaxID=4615 RepID=A0A6P5G4H4_ANACO|nr:putative ubiquitin-conjugating enzyme E2 38 isoform X4 [Ananas comosus]